ncbi:MAG: nickel transporter [Piscinibacter sp.]|nr:nickel transporter [Piscinibacter sp.]
MMLVPVIDLMRGEVVRAVRGARQDYRPIVSTLCAGSDPVTVAEALCRRAGARHLYAADLDALLGGAPQQDVLQRVLQALPDIELWLDAGFADPGSAAALRAALGPAGARVIPVFGSESLRSVHGLPRDSLLSLDRRDGRRLDPAGCWDAPQHWPERVIVMTLERVGADSGPDLDTLCAVQQRAPSARLIGAGGIRDAADLQRAAAAGAHAWLVASALHDGRIGDGMIDRRS